jgi:hypothetical protein
MLRLLVTIDLLLILMHVNVALSPDEVQGAWSDFFRIDRDLSLSEWFETAMMSAAIMMIVADARRLRRPCYLLLAVLLTAMLLDNVVGGHEKVGAWLAPEKRAVGEFALVAATTMVFAALACLAHRWARANERSGLGAMLIVLAVFALFAVAVDFMHELALALGPAIYAALAVVEEGGELLSLSVLLALVSHLTRSAPVGTPFGKLA